jgi:proteasome lid subunit RPN8/RPN11
MSDQGGIALCGRLHDRLVATVQSRLPRKSFGYLLSDGDPRRAKDFLLFEENLRNGPDWRGEFESWGRYFVDHDDAGFAASPEEAWRAQKKLWARGLVEVAVFHSHRRHPANFSRIDYELHVERFEALWHLIISMRNPHRPQVRAFAVSRERVRELEIESDA